MENVGLITLVTLSEFETPLSLADFRSGEPGVPGTRLSTTTVNDEVEDAELPASCAFAVNAYDPSSSGPTENWWVPAVTSLSVRVRAYLAQQQQQDSRSQTLIVAPYYPIHLQP